MSLRPVVLLSALGCSLAAATARGDVIVNYDLSTRPGTSDPATQAVNSVNPLMSASALTLGAGLGVTDHAGTFAAHTYDTGVTFNAANNDYFTFTVTPNAGVSYSLSTLKWGDFKQNNGPAHMLLRSSLDGFASNLFTWDPAAGNDPVDAVNRSFTFGAGFSNLTSSVELRLYGYNAGASAGDYHLVDDSTVGYFQLEGTAVPEPSSLVLAGLATAGAGFMRTRRRRPPTRAGSNDAAASQVAACACSTAETTGS